jgi:hypothetical protein
MTAKEYLSEVQRYENVIEHKREKLKEYRHAATSISSARMNPAKVQASSPADRIGDMMAKIVDLEAEIGKDMVDATDKRHEVINQIHKLDNVLHIQVLFGRYIQCKKMDDIRKDMGKSYAYILELHGQALNAFEEQNKGMLREA